MYEHPPGVVSHPSKFLSACWEADAMNPSTPCISVLCHKVTEGHLLTPVGTLRLRLNFLDVCREYPEAKCAHDLQLKISRGSRPKMKHMLFGLCLKFVLTIFFLTIRTEGEAAFQRNLENLAIMSTLWSIIKLQKKKLDSLRKHPFHQTSFVQQLPWWNWDTPLPGLEVCWANSYEDIIGMSLYLALKSVEPVATRILLGCSPYLALKSVIFLRGCYWDAPLPGLEVCWASSYQDDITIPPYLALKSVEPAATRMLLGCQSRQVMVERIGFLMCLLTHQSFSCSK